MPPDNRPSALDGVTAEPAWITAIAQQLDPIGPSAGEQNAEACGLAVLALIACERTTQALAGARWLRDRQLADGSVCMWGDDTFPKWPTSLALLAWSALKHPGYERAIEKATTWILEQRDESIPREATYGHDSTIPAWPWVTGTHGWIEPTALHTIALRYVGQGAHVRAHDGVRMLIDRQLPDGGCNYGNTTVLGQTLRPHVQPTGIAVCALSGSSDPAVKRSVDYLQARLDRIDTLPSLSWALLALTAHGIDVPDRHGLLQRAWENPMTPRDSCKHQSLLLLANHAETSVFAQLPPR